MGSASATRTSRVPGLPVAWCPWKRVDRGRCLGREAVGAWSTSRTYNFAAKWKHPFLAPELLSLLFGFVWFTFWLLYFGSNSTVCLFQAQDRRSFLHRQIATKFGKNKRYIERERFLHCSYSADLRPGTPFSF